MEMPPGDEGWTLLRRERSRSKQSIGGPCGLLTKRQIKRAWGTPQLATGSGDCVPGTDPAALEGKGNKCPSFSSVRSSRRGC